MRSETKLFLGIIVSTILVVAVGIVFLSKPVQSRPVDPSVLVRSDSHSIATESAKVTLVEFSDFQCPACSVYHPLVKQVINTFSDSLTFVYRHYPLPMHANAYIAAQAAEAAGLQGKYWEMHDVLFTKQDDWTSAQDVRGILNQYAESLGLNRDQFVKDIDSDTVRNIVSRDIHDGNVLGINATPTFFLNNRKIENPVSLADFERAIQAALSQK